MQHRLMILGSLYENVDLVLAAKKRGIYTIVCDGYKNGHAKNLADKYYDIDVRKTDLIAEICIKERVDGIVGAFSDLIAEKVTEVAHKAKLKWYIPYDSLKYYRDKKAAKDLLVSLGIKVPKNKLIKKDFSESDIEDLKFPLVIKPVNGWGSKGVYIVDNADELKEYIPKTVSCGDSDILLAEEYIMGKEYNVTAFIIDGKVNVISCGNREKMPSDDHAVPRLCRLYYDNSRHEDVIKASYDVMQRFAQAVGQQYGVLCMQCFYHQGELTVCEIAGRVFGYEHDIIGASSGLGIPDLLIDCVYDIDELKKKLEDKRGYISPFINARLLFFAKDQETVGNMDNVYSLCKFSNLIDDIIFYNEGDTVDNNSSRSYFASFSFTAKDKHEMNEITKYFFDNMIVYSEDKNNIVLPASIESLL